MNNVSFKVDCARFGIGKMGVWLGICMLWSLANTSADTVAYYRFEGSTSGGASAAWLSDSSGNGYTLDGDYGTVSQIRSVLNPVPGNALSNVSAASFQSSNLYTEPVTGVLSQMKSFTVEAFVNWQGAYTTGGVAQVGAIAAQWDATGNLYSYLLGVNPSGHPVLYLNSGNGAGYTLFTSTQTLTVGVNYYIGVSFDLTDTANGVKFYLLDLSNDQATIQLQGMPHSMPSLRAPTARLVVGNSAYSGSNNFFLGTIDELRISNVPLDRSGLLVSGPSFREFSGVNQTGTVNPLFAQALSYERTDLFWGSVEPTQGNWQQSALNQVGSDVLAYQAQNVNYLPVLDYMTDWNADMSPRQWASNDGATVWTIKRNTAGGMVLYTYALQSNNSFLLTSTYPLSSGDVAYFPPVSVPAWTNYVSQVTRYLGAPPNNVRYFQIWNEAYYTSGFWWGSMADYFQKIHLPAAAAIHASGGKVVYGGWPDVAPISELISDFDAFNVWGSIDAIDFHYLDPSTYATLRAAADSRGYTHLAIWQSECGFTDYIQFILDQYPRVVNWGLANNWDYTDKYKAIYYVNYSSGGGDAANGKSLYSPAGMTPQGYVLQTLGSLLNGPGLKPFTGLTTSPVLTGTLDTSSSAVEAFRVGASKIAIVMQLNSNLYHNYSNLRLNLPIPLSSILKAERIDLAGTRLDLTARLINMGTTTALYVPVQDTPGSLSRTWNDGANGNRGLLIQLTLVNNGNNPAAAPAPNLLGVVSRLTHGGTNVYDLPLPLTGDLGVECRKLNGGGLQLIASFDQPMTSASANVSGGAGQIGVATSFSGQTVVVNLTGVNDAQRLTVSLANLNGSGKTVSYGFGVLAGDVNGDGVVNALDLGQISAHSGQTVNTSNFQYDLNTDNSINSLDTGLDRNESGSVLQ